MARQLFAPRIEAASIGLNPLGYVSPETIQVLTEAGLPSAGLRSKGLQEIDLEACRVLVNLTDRSLAPWIPAPLLDRVLQRPVPDPFDRGLEAYRQAREAIRRLLTDEIAPLLLAP